MHFLYFTSPLNLALKMEHYTKRSPLSTIMHQQDTNPPQSPPHKTTLNHHHHHQISADNYPSSPTNTIYSLMPPPSPDSQWTLSPLQTPSPSLLHHCIATLHRHQGTVFSVAVSKGILFTGSNSRRIRAWKQPECTERGFLKSKSGEVKAMLAHGNMLFTSHKDHKVRQWHFTSSEQFKFKKITTLPPKNSILSFLSNTRQNKPKDCISCIAYYHAEGLLYTGSWDNSVNTWRITDNRCVDSFVAHDDQINGIAISEEDGCLFTCSSDGTVKIWRRLHSRSSHELTLTLKFQPSPVNAIALSATSGSCFLYSGSSDGLINFWEKEKYSSRYNHGGFLQGHRFSVLCLVAIEKLVFSGSEDTTIRVWRREEGSCLHECLSVIDAHRGPVRCLAVAMEMEKVVVMGYLVYSSGFDQTFKVWRIKILPEENCIGNGKKMMKMNSSNYRSNLHGDHCMEYEMSPVLSPSWVEKKKLHENFNTSMSNITTNPIYR